MKMHNRESGTQVGLVRRPLAAQFPRPTGTVNALYRLGDHYCARRRPLRELDAVPRAAIEWARGVIDSDAAAAAWRRALQAPAWAGLAGVATRRSANAQPPRGRRAAVRGRQLRRHRWR
jgi:hypothetical protein